MNDTAAGRLGKLLTDWDTTAAHYADQGIPHVVPLVVVDWLRQHATVELLEQARADLRAVLDEREQLVAIRDSRVREVRAAHSAGWLDHSEYVAERSRSGFDVRETAGQAYTATRIADWHAEPSGTTRATAAPGASLAASAPVVGASPELEFERPPTGRTEPYATGGDIRAEDAAAIGRELATNRAGCFINVSMYATPNAEGRCKDCDGLAVVCSTCRTPRHDRAAEHDPNWLPCRGCNGGSYPVRDAGQEG